MQTTEVNDDLTIQNPESEVMSQEETAEMNDRDYINDILATEKYLTDNFNIFTREASHSDLHADIKNILTETHENTRKIFNLMFEEGLYKLQAADEQQIQNTQQQFSTYFNNQKPY